MSCQSYSRKNGNAVQGRCEGVGITWNQRIFRPLVALTDVKVDYKKFEKQREEDGLASNV